MSRAHKDCKYCGDNILSSSMSSHLKQVHAAEVAREEKQLRDHAARCFGNAGKSQTKKGTRGKDGSSSEKPQDGAGSGKQQGLAVIECIGELIDDKIQEVVQKLGFTESRLVNKLKSLRADISRDVLEAVKSLLEQKTASTKEPAELRNCDSLAELVKFYDMGYSEAGELAWCQTCCASGTSSSSSSNNALLGLPPPPQLPLE